MKDIDIKMKYWSIVWEDGDIVQNGLFAGEFYNIIISLNELYSEDIYNWKIISVTEITKEDYQKSTYIFKINRKGV